MRNVPSGNFPGDRVLRISAIGPLQHRKSAGLQRQNGKRALQPVARPDVERRQPAPQPPGEPARQPLLAAEVDDMQLPVRRQPPQRLGQHARPLRDHRQGVGDENPRKRRHPEQARWIEFGGIGAGEANARGKPFAGDLVMGRGQHGGGNVDAEEPRLWIALRGAYEIARRAATDLQHRLARRRLQSLDQPVASQQVVFAREIVDVALAPVEAIVYQQLSNKAADTIYGRGEALYPRASDGFTPHHILRTADERLRGVGLSRAKVAALQDLAHRVHGGELPTLDEAHGLADAELTERLVTVRGIGRWSAEMFLMFRLGRPDVLPLGDYSLRKAYAKAFRKRALPSPEALEKAGERWRPYRTVASWYLWRALDIP